MSFIGKYVIVRTYSAGVHFGTLQSLTGTEAVLSNARRLWRWGGAFTLNEVAAKGISFQTSKLSDPVELIALTQAIEIIPVSENLIAQFKEAKSYDPI